MDYTGPDTVAQITSWLRQCVNNHSSCRSTLSGERFGRNPRNSSLDQSKLPTRILDVGSINSPLVKLLETTTETPSAPYVALSHCWGPPDKQPLTTTGDTLAEYISSGISMARLPRTFADAVRITRDQGIRYLWIDSLCILQDSQSDWEAESKRMSSIYEGATLTLGAAYARDSSEGLFKGLQRPDPDKIVRVDTPVSDNSDLTSYVTCFVPKLRDNEDPWHNSPLARRAWVMQEWSLSRRFVWSEKTSLHWKCRERTETEYFVNSWLGNIPLFDVLTSNWHRLMKDYARMQLTYESDRLVALRGIVTALKESYRKDQEYHFGVWLEGHKTPFSLLWEKTNLHADSPLEKCHQNIPSWSWASVPDEKDFTLPPDNTNYGLSHTRYYYDNRGFTAENNGTALHFRSPVGVSQLCLEGNFDDLCRTASASRYRRMSICIPTQEVVAATNRKGIASRIASVFRCNKKETCSKGRTDGVIPQTGRAMAFGCLTLDYTIDIRNCPTPSGMLRYVIPLLRQLYGDEDSTDYMLVVEPASKPDGSKAYRRVGMGFVKQAWEKEASWSCWEKMLSEMKMEDIVLV